MSNVADRDVGSVVADKDEPGSEIQAPMAVVILCGLVSSTALNMVVIPALYKRFGHFGKSAGLAN